MIQRRKIWIVVFVMCYFFHISAEKNKISKEDNIHSESESSEVFKPSHEWQTIKKGQPIPKGLHVRVNLQTGETEAKLLSNNERTEILSVHEDASETGDDAEADEHVKAVKESLKKLENQPEDDDNNNNLADAVREQFRSYKELKEAFRQLNMTVKTDLEIMHELVFKFKTLQKNKEKYSRDEMLLILTDLEYLVHQFDNALEFVKLDGIPDIVLPVMNYSQSVLRAEAAHLLGSAAQSNVKVQIAGLENGAISSLLRAVSLDSDPIVRIRSLYALSCLVRNFPAAQAKFVKDGGLSVLAELFEKGQQNHRLQIKVITLLHDLLLERQDTVRLLSETTATNKEELNMKIKQFKSVGLEETLLEHGWCSRIAGVLLSQDQKWSRTKKRDDITSAVTDLPVRNEHDFIEKVSETLLAMVNICHHDFNINSDLKKMLKGLREWYTELATKEDLKKLYQHVSESSDENDSEESYLYYSGIANILEQLVKELDKDSVKEEL